MKHGAVESMCVGCRVAHLNKKSCETYEGIILYEGSYERRSNVSFVYPPFTANPDYEKNVCVLSSQV